MSKEEVLSIIKEYPEAIIEALERKPELLTSLILKLAPWDRFATKEDIRMILEFMEKRFDDINKRFEDVNKRFEDMKYYVDRRFDEVNRRLAAVERIMIAFNIPILIAILTMLIKAFI
jgi:hypothetical protein